MSGSWSAVRRATGVLHAEAMQGIPLGGGLLVTAVALLVAVVARPSEFAPGWADPLNTALSSVLYLAPLSLAVAAAAAAQFSRTGLLALAGTTAKGRRHALGVGAASVAGWVLLALGLEMLVLLVAANKDGPFTPAMLLLPASACVVLLAATAVGAVLGARHDGWLVAPAAGLVAFVVLWFLALADGRLQVLSPVFTATFYQVPSEPNTTLVLLQIALGIGVFLVAWASTVTRGSTRHALVGVAVVVCAVALSGLTFVDPSPTRYRSAPEQTPCLQERGLTLCTWPESAPAAGSMLSALAQARSAAGDLVALPSHFREEGLPVPGAGPGRPGDPGVVVLPAQADPELLRFLAVRALVPEPRCRASRVAVSAWDDLLEWLTMRGDPSFVGREDVRAVVDGPPMQQKRWLDARVVRIGDCS